MVAFFISSFLHFFFFFLLFDVITISVWGSIFPHLCSVPLYLFFTFCFCDLLDFLWLFAPFQIVSFNPGTPPNSCHRPPVKRSKHLETALKVINQTDEFNSWISIIFVLFSFFFLLEKYRQCFNNEKKNIYIYIRIYYECSQRIPHPTKVLPRTVSKLLNK